jgi:hypothetical protein
LPHLSTALLQIGALGLLWAAMYTFLVRHTPPTWIPRFLDTRVRRTRAASRWVAAGSLLVLLAGAAIRLHK